MFGEVTGSGNKFSDPNGASDIDYGQARFVHSLGEMPACNVTYEFRVLYLHNDAETGLLGPLYPDPYSSQTISNSYCEVFAAGSSASASGNNLAVTVKISFKAPFAGNQNVYLMAGDWARASSGWQLKGTWTVGANQPPWVYLFYPNYGGAPANLDQLFTVVVKDSDGVADIDWTQMRFSPSLSEMPACNISYEFGQLWLLNDEGTALLDPIDAGSGEIGGDIERLPAASFTLPRRVPRTPVTFHSVVRTSPHGLPTVADTMGSLHRNPEHPEFGAGGTTVNLRLNFPGYPEIGSVENSASLQSGISPGQLVTIRGVRLSTIRSPEKPTAQASSRRSSATRV